MSEAKVSSTQAEKAVVLDERGQCCPMPIVHLASALTRWPLIELHTDDPAAPVDLEAFCTATGHEMVARAVTGRLMTATVRRKRGLNAP